MRRKFLLYFVGLAGSTLLLAGCGGPQNPVRIGEPASLFWSGLWDGLTVFIAFIGQVFNRNYGIYAIHQHSLAYNGGYVLGVCLAVAVLGWILNQIFG